MKKIEELHEEQLNIIKLLTQFLQKFPWLLLINYVKFILVSAIVHMVYRSVVWRVWRRWRDEHLQ